MNRIDKFKIQVQDQIIAKCRGLGLNPKIVDFQITSANIIIISVPASYTYVKKIYLTGSKQNDTRVLLDINSYLKESLENILVPITDLEDDTEFIDYFTEVP